ncbi:nucleotide exchange factor GrpE [Chlorobaculum sp. MV4-Y]|jgi:molecular chaperone GrpE|uniref:nucleotide exchange factor GrpE n=1 Tax=Chlorobaculum sp. MV4-Y TaxID=2976335 RepID=UPI0021AED762|nr:nucleotide exchange factor GrpE [Chlorobaculum sp. MV4-Y]UWX56812.1 nucleotide exchange factor GrpE [Chlorobaculum sp. MV4-Y]
MTKKHHKEQEEIQETINTEAAETAAEETAAIPAATEADMEAEIAARDAEIQKLREEVMRRAAEFENFRKQKEREAALSGTRMLENTVRDLLPLIDDLKRLMSHIPTEMQEMAAAKPFIEGVELIRKNFMSLLERKGVKEIEAKGKVLDVNFHEAITQIDAPGAEPDTIVEEYQTGYTLGDRVIRHAKVIVAK